jgi:Zn-dependent M28 family amino/carboxypeptidase
MIMPIDDLQTKLTEHVYTLSGDIGERNIFKPRALSAAKNYIVEQWEQQGYEVTLQDYVVKGIQCSNIEITHTGETDNKDIILIGAHYDSVQGSPGANDNGSGIAALLELSRIFTAATTKQAVRFVAFVNEEPPFFYWKNMGSMIYAKAARQRADKILFMVSLETIGYYSTTAGSQHYPPFFKWFYPDRGDFIAFVSNFKSRKIMRTAVSTFREHSNFPLQHLATFSQVPGVGWSDHLCFWRKGYRAFMVTDTALYRYPYYHSAQDTAEKIHYEAFTQVTEGLFRTFLALAQ